MKDNNKYKRSKYIEQIYLLYKSFNQALENSITIPL